MASHTHKHPLSGVARWTVPAALCSVGMMGAWLAPGASAMASTPAASSAVVIHSAVRAPSAKAVLAYWTPARLRRPSRLAWSSPGKRRRCSRPRASSRGSPARSRAASPNGHAAVAPSTKAISPEAFPYPYPYDSFTPSSSLWPTYPYEVNGKLFFTNNGGRFVCSATAVASASGTSNENEIWTAGHCLVNTEDEQPGLSTAPPSSYRPTTETCRISTRSANSSGTVVRPRAQPGITTEISPRTKPP